MKAWNLGNTTVRSPLRLQDGLRVLVNSSLHGNLMGKAHQQEFARLLGTAGVVSVVRLKGDQEVDATDLGRKWHGALVKLGFITPNLSGKVDSYGRDKELLPLVVDIPGLTGRPFEATPHGRRLLEAESVSAQQELFLRSLSVMQIPSPIEKRQFKSDFPIFNPLRIVLWIMDDLERRNLDSSLSFEEMRYIVQFVTAQSEVSGAVNQIQELRKRREFAPNKKQFDAEYGESLKGSLDRQSLGTTSDYADANLRYLKATGLFLQKGRGISIAPHRLPLVRQLVQAPFIAKNDASYLQTLWNGAPLPTDHPDQAREAIVAVADSLNSAGEQVDLPKLGDLGTQDLHQTLLDLTDRFDRVQEKQFADQQRNEWQGIVGYLVKLQNPRQRGEPVIPRELLPAYLEWAIWRAFLAIDSLMNPPWEARRFKLDTVTWTPVGTAPGGGADMVFEFSGYVLVVEVTMTTSSRQEAAEGEPVRRHVAETGIRYQVTGKPVFGLFIAPDIDTNTAETYRIGSWYRGDIPSRLDIVPLTLNQFIHLFEAGFKNGATLTPEGLRSLLASCLGSRHEEAPVWKQQIQASVQHLVKQLESRSK